jgi:tetratricopeptide (TPR) repeat protein
VVFELARARVRAPADRAALKARIGSVYCQVGDARGLPFLEAALAELDPGTQTNELALSLAFMGRYYHYRTEQRKAIEFLERARQLAEPLDDAATLAAIYSFLAGANQHMLTYPESNRWARKSIEFGERKNFPHSIANGYEFLAENCAGRGLWKDALAYAERDREFAAKSGSLARTAWAGFATVQALHGTGELVAARQVAEATLEMCGQIGETRLATWLDPMLTIVTADLGDDDAARMHAERGWARAQGLDQLVLTTWALHAAGRAAMQRGDVVDAMRWYEQYVPLVRETENALSRNLMLGCAAEAFLHAGRVDEAARMVRQAIEIGEFAASPHYLGIACRVHGQILAAQERSTEALHAFSRAVALFEETGSRLELGRVLCRRAALTLVHGDASAQAAARSELAAARDSFAAMGAAHDLAKVQRQLEPSGGHD